MSYSRHEENNFSKILSSIENNKYLIHDKDLLHTINLNLYGISSEAQKVIELKGGLIQYPEINILLPTCKHNGEFAVPRKIPIVPEIQTPYRLINGNVLFEDNIVFKKETVQIIPLADGKPRNYKGYSLSFEGTKTPFVELRINPKNSGYCPGRCLFCHRAYSYRIKPLSKKSVFTPNEIVDSIIKKYGNKIFQNISYVTLITELYGSESKFLAFLTDFKKILLSNGSPENIKIGACSQDVRSSKGLKELYNIVNPKKYSFTLETFSRRNEIMGKYKGIPIDKIINILKNARRTGFDELKLNYVAGIDSYSDFEKNIVEFKKLDLVDSMGISILTVFFSDQKILRHIEAYEINYYLKIVKLIKELGISFYKPANYEMGLPLKLLDY